MQSTKRMLAGAALALALAAPAAAEPVKVGYIYVGPIGDYGYSHEHNVGRLAVDAHFGDKVETSYVESVPEGADAERVMTQMALAGTDIIFATSFGYMDPVNNVAARFPDVRFEHATGYKREHPNVALYNARFYEGRAVIGHIAARMTKTNVIGYIASYPIPEVIMGINAAYLHARKANPQIQFKIVWAYTWFDPALEADAANALIEQGADVIMQHTDSTAPMAIAEQKGFYAFGQASDMIAFGPNAQLTAIIDNWGPYYIDRVQKVIDGTWESQDVWLGMKEDMVVMAPLSERIPADVRAEAEAMMAAIKAGTYHPFTGPINRQDGTPWLAAGEVADDKTLLGMNFYVEGIEGAIPN
ncbi:MAG: BMP family ABC transporter substrate-binding protein [Rhodobacteraceae bacterium]|nr:BMP family ABC transporter substrate-binding protein [Paracoccaceae bacterium]